MHYHKLVRDKIPDLFAKKGKRFKTHRATEAEYAAKLREKLLEEAHEFVKDGSFQELADVLEVVYALAEYHGLSKTDLDKLRAEKALDRGTFSERIILDHVDDRDEY